MSRPEPYPREIAIPPLLGRAGVFSAAQEYQLFAQLTTTAGEIVLPDVGQMVSGVGWFAPYLPQTPDGPCGDGMPPLRHKCERLWRISTASQVVYRASQVPLIPLTPSQFDAFEVFGATLPGNAAQPGGNGWFRLWVRANDATSNRRFFMDLDETVEIYAYDVQALIVGPPNAVSIVPNDNDAQSPTPAMFGGTVVDLRVGASIMPIESPTGMRDTRFTQMVVVPQATQAIVTIPRFARAVKIYQSTAGAGAGPWLRMAGSPAIAFNVGQINFTNRRSDTEDAELGRESHLLTDIDALVARTFIVQWTMVP